MLVIGIAAMFAAIGVFANMIGSGELTDISRRRKVRRQVQGLNDHYIVCAYGRVGRSVVRELKRHGQPFVVVDIDPALEERFIADKVPHLIADPSEEEVLRGLGVEKARGLICAVDSDETNVYITLTARTLNPGLTIVARASRRHTRAALEKAGADHVISPYEISGRRMASLSLRPSLLDFIEMVTVGPGLRLDEIAVRRGSPLIGVTVERTIHDHPGVSILAVKHGEDAELIPSPPGDTLLAEGDLVVAFGPRTELDAIEATQAAG